MDFILSFGLIGCPQLLYKGENVLSSNILFKFDCFFYWELLESFENLKYKLLNLKSSQ